MAGFSVTSHSFLLFVVLASVFLGNLAQEPAWNGYTTPGSTSLTTFTPYYVPPGAKSYDSSSPLIHYRGTWSEDFSKTYVGHSVRWTTSPNASLWFTFTGTGIEWFGNMGKRHGISDVCIDDQPVQSVSAWSPVSRKQQRIYWKYDLPYGRHSMKIFNTGRTTQPTRLDLDAFVVTKGEDPNASITSRQSPDMLTPMPSSGSSASSATPRWTMVQNGSTGVNAMQLAIISDSHALIVDKVEHNPLTISGHPAWAALFNLKTHAVRPLNVQSNSFCAGGSFLSNGTLIVVGGNPVVDDVTSSADFGNLNGLQAIRLFNPCDSESADGCAIQEDHARIRMASPRWYTTPVRISDGSVMIIGGSKKGGWINNATVNNPTIEYFPPKSIHNSNGLPIDIPFLSDTLNSNLFPIAFSLPDGTVFMAANQDAMIYNWQTNSERRLPPIPNGIRVTYPMAGTGLLLPLSPDNDYVAEILLCGGSAIDDKKPSYEISSQDASSAQCSRLVLTDDGIASGWEVEQMPEARLMSDAVLLPTGDVLIVNGAGTGISGYGNIIDQIGASNADNPVLTPVLYNPHAPNGKRFSSEGMPTSSIPRMYHSVATLTPDGEIMVAGSNPNLDRSEIKFGTEYRVEWIKPAYVMMERPAFGAGFPKTLGFGQVVKMHLREPTTSKSDVKVALMDLGYVTHAVHANSRLVYLTASLSEDGTILTITGPPSSNIYPPGPGWLYVIVGGVPSTGRKVMVGEGQQPPVDPAALDNMLKHTTVDQSWKEKDKDGSE